LVAELEPAGLDAAGKFLVRDVDTTFEQLETNASRLRLQFDAIAVLDYSPSYEHAGIPKERARLPFPSKTIGNNVEYQVMHSQPPARSIRRH
jgi:hypothetical protein